MSLDIYLECDHCGQSLFDYNITHNLNTMAEAAGVYMALWRPEEIGVTTAAQLVGWLESGRHELETFPDKYKALNPDNGWGDYEGLLKCVDAYLRACKSNPTAKVRVSR